MELKDIMHILEDMKVGVLLLWMSMEIHMLVMLISLQQTKKGFSL